MQETSWEPDVVYEFNVRRQGTAIECTVLVGLRGNQARYMNIHEADMNADDLRSMRKAALKFAFALLEGARSFDAISTEPKTQNVQLELPF